MQAFKVLIPLTRSILGDEDNPLMFSRKLDGAYQLPYR
jgi:hypothetical protein